jgi:dolichol-phosphate mannosyltransferase
MKLSIVLPVYNEAQTLHELFTELVNEAGPLADQLELVFVNDGSRDGSLTVMQELKYKYGATTEILIVDLTRNFGHAAAVAAGITHASGDALVVMDTDLQDDPRAIAAMVERWRQGVEVVYAVRSERKENLLLRWLFDGYYWLFARMTSIDVPSGAGNFGLIDRRVADEIRQLPEHDRYFPGLRAWVGFRQEGIEVPRRARAGSSSRVGMRGLVELALNAIFGFSTLPLRLSFVIALLLALAGVCGIGIIFYIKLFTGKAVIMWSSIMCAVLFMGSVQFFLIGLLGEYVSRIYNEVKQRPHYIVRRIL